MPSAAASPEEVPVRTSGAPASTLSVPSAAVPPPLAELVLPDGALFAYREGDVSLAFMPPRRLTLLGRPEKPCSYELGDNGNMYSGAEVEAAWRNAEVAAAVAQSRSFLSTDALALGAEARGAKGRIMWTPFCGGLCIEGPPGVTALAGVLQVLARNVRGVCKP